MRLRARDLRTLDAARSSALCDDLYQWHAKWTISAAIYPAGDRISTQLYGDRAACMRLLLAEPDQNIALGDGICVDDTAQPDYRVVALERWSHIRATLEYIPEGNRGGWISTLQSVSTD